MDKFSYLRGLLIEPVQSGHCRFCTNLSNYGAAIELLRKRNSRKTAIQWAHVNDLLNLEAVHSKRDTPHTWGMYDFAETKYCALEALGVDQSTFWAIIVTSPLEKMPEHVPLTIMKGQNHQDWNLKELLEALECEIELREEYNKNTHHTRTPWDSFRRKIKSDNFTVYYYSVKPINCKTHLCKSHHVAFV